MAAGQRALFALTITAVPVAFAFESLLRLAMPPEFEEVRTLLGPYLALPAWGLSVLCTITVAAGLALQTRLVSRRIARLPEARRTPAAYESARTGAFLLAASVPQLPALFATIVTTFGGPLTPALVTITVSTAGVIVQAIRARG